MDQKIDLTKQLRVARHTRIIAKAIDLFIVLLLVVLFYPLGVFLGLLYIGLADSFQSGSSVGKKLLGFKVIDVETKETCSVRQSIIRNLPFLIPIIFIIFPFWGMILSVFVGIPLVLLELYLIFTLDTGKRLGDVMAGTTVMVAIDSKEKISDQSITA